MIGILMMTSPFIQDGEMITYRETAYTLKTLISILKLRSGEGKMQSRLETVYITDTELV